METPEEVLVAEWEQPDSAGLLSSKQGFARAALAVGGVAAVLIGLAVWQRELNYVLVAAVLVLSLVAVRTQNKRGSMAITLTNLRIAVGKRQHFIEELAGYWLRTSHGFVEINLETKRPSLVPITFLANSTSLEEVAALLRPLLPEVEPRDEGFADQLARRFRM
jgi:hypothetical protein